MFYFNHTSLHVLLAKTCRYLFWQIFIYRRKICVKLKVNDHVVSILCIIIEMKAHYVKF